MKKIILSIVALLCVALNASAGDVLYKTLSFPADKQPSISAYACNWEAVKDGMTWKIVNFNNNKGDWAYIKCGTKNGASVATISTLLVPEKITKLVLVTSAVTADYVNAVYLEVASDTLFTKDVQKIQPAFAKGEVTYAIPTQGTNLSYRFTFDCKQSKSNGVITLTKIDMYKYDASTLSTPTFTPAAGTFYEPQTVAITGDEGADLYYSYDGESYSKYSTPLTISETKTLYAYAQNGEIKSEVKSGEFAIAKQYASLDALLQETPTEAGWPVSVPFESEEIASFDGSSSYRSGVFLTRQAGGKNFELYGKDSPSSWAVGTKISGTAKGTYKIYGEQWEIALVNWDGITADGVNPPTIEFNADTKTVTITDPSGAGNSIFYTTDGSEPDDSKTLYSAPFTISETTTVKAICVDDLDNASAVTTKVCALATTYNDLASIAKDAAGYTSSDPLVTTLNLNDVLVTGVNGSCVYISDATGVFQLYGASSGLVKGDKIGGQVAGKAYSYYGMPEMTVTDSWASKTVVSQGNTVTPTKMVAANVTAADVNKYIRFEGLKYVSQEGTGKVNYTLTDGTTNVILRDNFKVLGDMTFNTDDQYNINVFVAVYNDAIQYYAVDAKDVEVISSKDQAVCKFVNFEDNQLFDLSKTKYTVCSCTIESDAPELIFETTDSTVATIEFPGVLVINFKNPGVAKVTFGVPATEYYTAAKDSRTVRVYSGATGTSENPYCVGDVKALFVDGDTTDVWVKAYIVGNADGSMSKASFSDTLNVKTNLLLADDANETNILHCIPLELPKNKKIYDVEVRDSLALPNHPENYKKQILIHASIIKYFSQAGLKSITDYKFVEAGGLKGDANNDGDVDVTDITTIASYILGQNPSPFNKDNADANGDGEIDVTDITTTASIILGTNK